jgi:excinuclease ABC subunit C
MSGTDTVASMVVFTDGVPNKGEYRKFRMRIPGNDDFAHMNEVIKRRFSGENLRRWSKPDLLLIDGGKGQLGAAVKALGELNVDLPAVGLAKRFETIILRSGEEILLHHDSHVLKLLQRIRDESHRFAVSYHTVLKGKRQTASLLDDLPGVGPATRKKLLRTFGSMRGVTQAQDFELEKIIGAKKAAILKQYIRASKKEVS